MWLFVDNCDIRPKKNRAINYFFDKMIREKQVQD
jgi:hypothetical protein